MRYNYPKKEEFELKFNLNIAKKEKWSKITITLSYEQATIQETMDFLRDIEKWWQSEWMTNFLKKYSNIWKNPLAMWLLKLDKDIAQKMFDNILDTRFRWVFDKNQKKKEKKKEDDVERPYSSVLLTICEKINIDPETFQNRYTIEQMNYFIDWIVFNANETTEEGRELNRKRVFNDKYSDDELLDLIS